jgi:hypothetical protein
MASDHNDSSDWSSAIDFTLSSNTSNDLTENDCIYPPNGGVINTDLPIFIVDYVAGIEYIYIQVDDNGQFDSPVESGPLEVTPGQVTNWEIPEPVNQNTLYFWRASSDNIFWTSPLLFTAVLDIYAYPVPFRISEGHQNIVFKNLPSNSKISIVTVSGKIVKTEQISQPGDWVWDVKNNDGKEVASGVYLYHIRFKGGPASGKLMVIR